jgi:hypothetical protein
MPFEKDNQEILDLFKLNGKEIPHEDSDIGQAIAVLQTIADRYSFTIPDADGLADDVQTELESLGWTFYPGTAASNPYAVKDDVTVDGNDKLSLIANMITGEHIEPETDTGSEVFDALDELEDKMNSDDDFSFEFDGNEYRIIKDSSIWEIYRDEIQSTVEECYDLKLDNIPNFVAFAIDWEQTAKNAYVDGYGHTFSSYDGSEEQAGEWWIFRTN